MILRESQGTLSSVTFREYLLQCDARLNLEYDVAWANQFIIDHLLHLFPASKFIILISDSYTWLQSVIGRGIPTFDGKGGSPGLLRCPPRLGAPSAPYRRLDP